MKKQILLLTTIFIVLIAAMIAMPNNVFAAFPEGMSEEFKAILNEEGQLEMTDTSDYLDKMSLISNKLNLYQNDEYFFNISANDEEAAKCQIDRVRVADGTLLETYEIDIKYAEKFSDEFKEILDENGDILITFSGLNSKAELLQLYLSRFLDEEKYFDVFLDENWNETSCTVQMYKLMGDSFTIAEQHIVDVVFEEKFSDDFKNLLDKDGNFVVTSTTHEYEEEYNPGIDRKIDMIDLRCDQLSNNSIGVIRGETKEDGTVCVIELHDNTSEFSTWIEQHAVKIVYKESISDDFKTILNENGKILITSSSLAGKHETLVQHCDAFDNERLNFDVNYTTEDGTACTVTLWRSDNEELSSRVESHIVEVEYKEVISNDFKKILNADGNIVIKSSCDSGFHLLLDSYCRQVSNDEFYFSAMEVSEDGTKCVIEMNKNIDSSNSSFVEKHVVNVVYDKNMSNDFKKVLNSDGKFVINSVKPTTEEEWWSLFDLLYMIPTDYEWAESNMAEDFSAFDLTIVDSQGYPETHRVKVVYKYDERINSIAKELLKNLPEDKVFAVKDMELINYWLHSGEEETEVGSNFDNYSSELKKYVENKNFKFYIDNRMGADDEFYTMRAGIGLLQYNNATYGIRTFMELEGKHILYVPDNTASTKEALVAAVQKRVDEYAGEGKVKISAGEGTIEKYYEDYYNKIIKAAEDKIAAEKAKENPDKNLIMDYEWDIDMNKMYKEDFKYSYTDPEGDHYFLQSAVGGFWFVATIDGVNYEFIVNKDSDKMITPTHKTADLSTNVEISTTSISVPLDTAIEAEKLTSGDDYDRVIKILDVKDNETYDLRLYSNSLNEYVTKLEDGTFEVRLPLPDKFKDKKDLKVYYVEENGKIQEYDVTIEDKDGYVVFTTNHFSIYTLAEKVKFDINEYNSNVGSMETVPGGENFAGSGEPTVDKGNKDKTPNTGILDISNYVVALTSVSALGIIALRKRV